MAEDTDIMRPMLASSWYASLRALRSGSVSSGLYVSSRTLDTVRQRVDVSVSCHIPRIPAEPLWPSQVGAVAAANNVFLGRETCRRLYLDEVMRLSIAARPFVAAMESRRRRLLVAAVKRWVSATRPPDERWYAFHRSRALHRAFRGLKHRVFYRARRYKAFAPVLRLYVWIALCRVGFQRWRRFVFASRQTDAVAKAGAFRRRTWLWRCMRTWVAFTLRRQTNREVLHMFAMGVRGHALAVGWSVWLHRVRVDRVLSRVRFRLRGGRLFAALREGAARLALLRRAMDHGRLPILRRAFIVVRNAARRLATTRRALQSLVLNVRRAALMVAVYNWRRFTVSSRNVPIVVASEPLPAPPPEPSPPRRALPQSSHSMCGCVAAYTGPGHRPRRQGHSASDVLNPRPVVARDHLIRSIESARDLLNSVNGGKGRLWRVRRSSSARMTKRLPTKTELSDLYRSMPASTAGATLKWHDAGEAWAEGEVAERDTGNDDGGSPKPDTAAHRRFVTPHRRKTPTARRQRKGCVSDLPGEALGRALVRRRDKPLFDPLATHPSQRLSWWSSEPSQADTGPAADGNDGN